MGLLRDFLQNGHDKGLFHRPVLLAVSGGVDSMAMADLYHRAKLSFAMAHCNFQLRGEASGQDEALVRRWAKEKKIRLFSRDFDTSRIARERRTGIQETARYLRYDWFFQLIAEQGFWGVATAHHADDQAETLLFHLFRGTGLAGLGGMVEHSDKIIRPVLFATKKQLRDYADQHEIPFREDESNRMDKYKRNAIRLKIIPTIEKYFPQVVQKLSEEAQLFQEAEIVYRREIDRQLRKLRDIRGRDIYIPIRKLRNIEPRNTLYFELFRPYGFSSAQIQELKKLEAAGSGRFLESESYRVFRDRDFLIITEKNTERTDLVLIDQLPHTVKTDTAIFRFTETAPPKHFPKRSDEVFVDRDDLVFPLLLRKWRPGDYFYPLGMDGKKKKLSRFFIDQKIPVHKKERVWVLESKKRIVWVAGLRLDDRFRIRPATRNAVRMTYQTV